MAQARRVASELKIAERKSYENFENFIKTRLSWQREEWEEEGETNFKLRKLTNSMRYWCKKLEKAQRANNVILTLYNDSENAKVDLTEILDAIWLLDKDIIIKGFTNFRNPRYVSITFENEKIRNFVQTNLKCVGLHNVVFLNWAGSGSIHSIRIHWFPDDIEIEHTKGILERYFNITEMHRESTTMLSGLKLPCGIVQCKGIAKKDVNIEQVPHLVQIDGLECLLTIYGRKYLCLNCDKVGHKARNCQTPYCFKCRELMPKLHQCVQRARTGKTFAQAVRGAAVTNERNGEYEEDTTVEITVESGKNYEEFSEIDGRGEKNTAVIEEIISVPKLESGEKSNGENLSENSEFANKESSPMNREDTNINVMQQEEKPVPDMFHQGELEENDFLSSGSEDDFDAEEACKFQVENMERHLSELKNLGAEVGRFPYVPRAKLFWDDSQEDGEEDMSLDHLRLKRKSDTVFGSPEDLISLSGERKTYRKRGGGSTKKANTKMKKNSNSKSFLR